MKDNKNKENVILENKALNGAMQELGDDELDEIAGAGNPFANVARVPTQPIDEDMRNKV